MSKGGRPQLELKGEPSVEELNDHFRACSCAVERRRTQVVWWLREGRSRQAVRELSAYSSFSVLDVIKRYNEQGLAGLQDRRHDKPGAPRLLSDEEVLLLAQIVRKDFEKGIVWDGAKVVRWRREEVGKDVPISRAYETLSAIGFSPQLPRPAPIKAAKLAQDRFKKNTA